MIAGKDAATDATGSPAVPVSNAATQNTTVGGLNPETGRY
jgi:hypothetical protein